MFCYGRILFFFTYPFILFLVSNIPHGRHSGQISLHDYLLYDCVFTPCVLTWFKIGKIINSRDINDSRLPFCGQADAHFVNI